MTPYERLLGRSGEAMSATPKVERPFRPERPVERWTGGTVWESQATFTTKEAAIKGLNARWPAGWRIRDRRTGEVVYEEGDR